jgi:hypothetical protein
MPSALLRSCASPGCPELTDQGRCQAHRRQAERWRGSAASRGYGHSWTQFREWFKRQLVANDVPVVCGAALPGGPSMQDSQCKADGVLNEGAGDGKGLNLDHDPPLQDWERADRRRIENPMCVGFLCARCHSARTRRHMNAGGGH